MHCPQQRHWGPESWRPWGWDWSVASSKPTQVGKTCLHGLRPAHRQWCGVWVFLALINIWTLIKNLCACLSESWVIGLKLHLCSTGISHEKNQIHHTIYRKDFKAVILKSAVSGAAVASSENQLKMQILRLYPRPTKILLKLWGFGSAIHVLQEIMMHVKV